MLQHINSLALLSRQDVSQVYQCKCWILKLRGATSGARNRIILKMVHVQEVLYLLHLKVLEQIPNMGMIFDFLERNMLTPQSLYREIHSW